MNERIKQIVDAVNIPHQVGDNCYTVSEKELEKFAELIVNECTNIVTRRKDAAIDASWNVDEAMSNAVWDIEEHFYGVQE